MVDSVPAFQPDGPGSIPGGVRILIYTLGLGVCPFSILSCSVSGGGPDIVLTTHSRRPAVVRLSSVLVHSLLLPLQASRPTGI